VGGRKKNGGFREKRFVSNPTVTSKRKKGKLKREKKTKRRGGNHQLWRTRKALRGSGQGRGKEVGEGGWFKIGSSVRHVERLGKVVVLNVTKRKRALEKRGEKTYTIGT